MYGVILEGRSIGPHDDQRVIVDSLSDSYGADLLQLGDTPLGASVRPLVTSVMPLCQWFDRQAKQ